MLLDINNSIINFTHPFYSDNLYNWTKWRFTYEGGDPFIKRYLKQFSIRETNEEFLKRKEITYCPAFAKAALNDVKNSIFQRATDITRVGGPKSYQDAVTGRNGGVDRGGNSMNSFIGRRILPELLSMARVGIFVDMPQLSGPTISDKGNARPYIYFYRTEQIRSWTFDYECPDNLLSVLLEDYDYTIDEKTGLTTGLITNFRHLWINDEGFVEVQYYDLKGVPSLDSMVLTIKKIPFIILELSDSLLTDVANYQIALLNLESSDLSYALRSNFPFYTEQFDPKSVSPYLKPSGNDILVSTDKSVTPNVTRTESAQQISVGTAAGRRYPIGSERPGFINPSSEPLRISMDKAAQIKRDIRQLINLTIQNLEPRRASAESKTADNQSLENGLSYIGLELEYGERKIAELWSMFEGTKDITTINYPENYSIRNEADRQAESKFYEALIPKVPSKTFQKEATKRIIDLTLGCNIPYIVLQKINAEIDKTDVLVSDPDIIDLDIKNGLVSAELASKIRGYPEGEVEVAAREHAEKLARIAISQSKGIAGVSGVPELQVDKKAPQEEKQLSQDNTYDATPKEKVRGKGVDNYGS